MDSSTLNFDSTCCELRCKSNVKHRMANCVHHDKKARYETSDLDLHCLLMYPFSSAELKQNWSIRCKDHVNQWNIEPSETIL